MEAGNRPCLQSPPPKVILMEKAESFCCLVDSVNRWVGRTVAWAVVPMMIFVVIDVTLRYGFSRPTIWAWDINVQLLGLIGIMGAGYTLLYGGHIGVDVMAAHLSPRKRAILDLITALLFFFGFGIMLWQVWLSAANSIQVKEVYLSVFKPTLVPLRIVIVIGVALLVLQGISKFIRDLTVAINPERAKQP